MFQDFQTSKLLCKIGFVLSQTFQLYFYDRHNGVGFLLHLISPSQIHYHASVETKIMLLVFGKPQVNDRAFPKTTYMSNIPRITWNILAEIFNH